MNPFSFSIAGRVVRSGRSRHLGAAVLLWAGLCAVPALHAAPFDVAVLPSRFELAGKGGVRLGQAVEITNMGAATTQVAVRTLDWSYSPEGNVTYHDELREGSCRPWVALERRTVAVPPRAKRSVRFQVEPPAGVARGECRFMVAIEGVEPAQQAVIQSNGASLNLPVTGRIAVAVYVRLEGAAPRLELTRVGMQEAGGRRMPSLTVTNAGDAHGRLDGSLEAVDAQGRSIELVPEGTPILPGQTRTLPLLPRAEADRPPPAPAYPLKASGTLDWDLGSFRVNAEFR